MWMIILLGALVALIYHYGIKPMSYWKNKNVIHEKPVPLFGSMLPLALRTRSMTEIFSDLYVKYKNERYFGMFNFKSPLLVLCEPDLIKTVFVKEFDTFPEHRQLLPKNVDQLWSKNLFAMEGGEEWHDLRSTLSPSFTSSKMKGMFGFMKECSQQFSKHFIKSDSFVEVELKDTFTRFANDVIATTAFGITCNSLSDPKNEFYVLAKELSSFTGGIRGFIFMLYFFAPSLAEKLCENGRLFPVLDRRSVKPFTIEPRNSNERRLDLEKGSVIICPVGGIHLNPKYYPNPNKFDPERFNDENRHNILPYTYLPFGAGPRNCIGSRFALLEGKLVVAEIVRKFEICPVEKTQIPIVFSKRNFNPVPDEGFWVGLKPRTK